MGTPGGAGGGIWLGPPDPNDVRAVLEVPAAPGPLGAGGTFLIDPERAEECINSLRAVVLDLTAMMPILDLAYFPPPGVDQVSVNMANQARVMADRAGTFITTWRQQIADTISALGLQLEDYRGVDQASGDQFV